MQVHLHQTLLALKLQGEDNPSQAPRDDATCPLPIPSCRWDILHTRGAVVSRASHCSPILHRGPMWDGGSRKWPLKL